MKKYSIIYADPPWQYKVYSKKGLGRSAESHYPTMALEDIQALPVSTLAADDCVLFMWTTIPLLYDCFSVIRAWGFSYKTVAFVWIKQNRKSDSLFWGMGHWTRANAEFCMAKRAPRLQFTDEELSAPEVRKAAQKADRRAEKLEKAEAKIPKKTLKTEARMIDPDTGKVTTRVFVSETEKKRPPSKLKHAVSEAPGAALSAAAHREIRASEEDNVGVESAHKLESAGEGSIRFAQAAHRSHAEKPYRKADHAAAKADMANLRALYRQAEAQNPESFSNPYSKWQQKQAIKKEYAAAKTGHTADQTIRAGETTAKAAKRASEAGQKVSEFVSKHKKGFLIVGAIAAMLLMLLNVASSCSVLTQGGASAVGISTYPSADADMLAAEAQYCAMEAELQARLDNYEAEHDYDE